MVNYPFYGYPAVYVDPDIVTFAADTPVVELGSTVDNVVLRWTLSKTPLGLTFNGAAIAPNTTLTNIQGPFTADQSWRLGTSDEIKTVYKTATLTFLNKGYWGVVDAAPVSSAEILALPYSDFLKSNVRKRIEFGTLDGQFPCYCFPSRLGTPSRVLQGPPAAHWVGEMNDWEKFTDFSITSIKFTNASGFTEAYSVLVFNQPLTLPNLLVWFNPPTKPDHEHLPSNWIFNPNDP